MLRTPFTAGNNHILLPITVSNTFRSLESQKHLFTWLENLAKYFWTAPSEVSDTIVSATSLLSVDSTFAISASTTVASATFAGAASSTVTVIALASLMPTHDSDCRPYVQTLTWLRLDLARSSLPWDSEKIKVFRYLRVGCKYRLLLWKMLSSQLHLLIPDCNLESRTRNPLLLSILPSLSSERRCSGVGSRQDFRISRVTKGLGDWISQRLIGGSASGSWTLDSMMTVDRCTLCAAVAVLLCSLLSARCSLHCLALCSSALCFSALLLRPSSLASLAFIFTSHQCSSYCLYCAGVL